MGGSNLDGIPGSDLSGNQQSKAILRKASERTIDRLWSAIGQIIDTITPTEAKNYFSAAGYDPS